MILVDTKYIQKEINLFAGFLNKNDDLPNDDENLALMFTNFKEVLLNYSFNKEDWNTKLLENYTDFILHMAVRFDDYTICYKLLEFVYELFERYPYFWAERYLIVFTRLCNFIEENPNQSEVEMSLSDYLQSIKPYSYLLENKPYDLYYYRYFETHMKIGFYLEASNRKKAAIKIYKKILPMYKYYEIDNLNSSSDDFYYFLSLGALANNYQSLNNYKKSIHYYRKYFHFFFSSNINEAEDQYDLNKFLIPFIKYYHISYLTGRSLIKLDAIRIEYIKRFKQKLGLKKYIETIKETYEEVYEDYIESLDTYNSNIEERYKMFIDFYIEKEFDIEIYGFDVLS